MIKGALSKFLIPKNWSIFLGVCLFALIYVNIPYESIRGDVSFVDLGNYERNFSEKSYALVKAGGSIKGYISNEVLWDVTVRWLMRILDMDPRGVLKITSFISIFFMASYVRRGAGWWWLLFLFNPLLIDFVMSQCRLSFAMGLFFASLLTKRKLAVLLISCVSLYIHTAMLVFVGLYWLAWLAFRYPQYCRKHVWVGIFILSTTAIFIAALMGPLNSLAAGFYGEDRRIGRYIQTGSSLTYASFWILLIPIFSFIRPKLCRIPNVGYALSILVLFSATVVFDVYGSRFVAAALPCIICSVFRLDGNLKTGVVSLFAIFTMAQLHYWL
ncbi:hypothetical protein Rhal01_01382 [Rubritalea halochordaticola]|uniref:EpsG family protein n=1 Tax=Rubritalea halochordaticola TaxID=714537 RepID=A0ABP9UXW2_9BACT